MTEVQIDERINELFGQWHAGLITNREVMGAITMFFLELPPITVGDLDPNTGLRYTEESIKQR